MPNSSPPLVFYSPWCGCADLAHRRAAAELVWCSVEDHWGHAISLGIVRLPAIVVGSQVIAQGGAALTWLRNRPEDAN